MDVGKLQISVDLNADDLAAEITKAVEKQLEPVLAKIREQINATARDLNKIDGKKFIEVAIDAKAAQSAVDAQGRASAKAAGENEANAKALRDLAKAEAEFAAAQKSGDLVQRSMAMSKLTQAMKDYEKATGQSASAADRFADSEVKGMDKAAQATERRSTVSARAAQRQVANHKSIQDAFAKTQTASDSYADKAIANETRIQAAIDKTMAARRKAETEADDLAKRAAMRPRSGGGGGGRGGGGSGGGGGGSNRPDEGYYSQPHRHGVIARAALSPIGANVIGLGLAGVPAATLAVTDLVSAIGQLAQSGLAVPGIMAGIGVSIGTLTVGLSGMKKAVSDLTTAMNANDPAAMKKATDEMKDMAPAARDTAVAIAALTTGPLKDLRKQVEGNMFAGMAGEVKMLGDTLIPHLAAGMGSVATAWNQTFKAIGATATSGGNLSLIDRIFGDTAQAQQRANAAIAPLTHGMAQLTASGTDFLPRLADGLTKVSTRFDQFISKSVQNGNLDKWIDAGLTGMTHLGDAAINLGKALEGIFKADDGRNFLDWLDKATQRWAQFTNSTQGQAQLKAFFKEAADDLHRWEPVLGNIFKVIGQIIGGAQAWSHVMLPFLQTMTDLLLHIPDAISGITFAFLAWRTMSGVESLLSLIGRINGGLATTATRARTAGEALATVDAESAAGTGGGGGAVGGRRGAPRSRMGKLGMGAASLGMGVGIDQLMSGIDPSNNSNQGIGGWLQAVGGGAGTGASIGTMIEPGIGTAIGAAIGAGVGAAIKGIEGIFGDKPKDDKPLVSGALQGQDYQNALSQVIAPGGPGGQPWNQKLMDQAFYGSDDSFDPRKSAYATMNKGDANYNTVLAEMQKGPQGAFSSIPGLTGENAQTMLDKIVKQAHDASGALDSLGGAITDLPTGEIVITDPTQAILDRVKALGGELHSLPSGLIAINTDQLNAAQHQADELQSKLAKLLVPGMALTPDGKALMPDASPSSPPPSAGDRSLFPIGHASGGIVGRFASGGVVGRFDSGGKTNEQSPWRTLGTLGASFIDDAAVLGTKGIASLFGGGGGALGTGLDVLSKVMTPLGFLAPEIMDAIEPQARTSSDDTTTYSGHPNFAPGAALATTPGAKWAQAHGVLPGYSPGVDNLIMPTMDGKQAALGGGEGIVIPEAMKALGPDWLYGLNNKYRPGLSRSNYSGGGVVGSFAPGGTNGPVPPFDPLKMGPAVDNPNNSVENLLLNIKNLLGGQSYGPLTQMQFSSQIQQMYLQKIASGGTLPGTLAPGTTPGHVGPFGTPVAPINKTEAAARGAISSLGGNPDIIFGPDSVKYGQEQSETITSALKQAAGQPGGLAALNRPTDPSAYIGPLTTFAQNGIITPEMKAMGLDVGTPIVDSLNTARNQAGDTRNQIPAMIGQSLSPGGYTGPLTPENQSILGSLNTFRDTTQKQGMQRQQLDLALGGIPGVGGVAGLPAYLAQHPEIGPMIGLPALGAVPGAGGAFSVGSGAGGNAGLASVMQARNLPPQLQRLIQGFSQTEGNNPAGNPTLGFRDDQVGGASDIGSHVDALLKQMQDRSGVAGSFPVNGTDQDQATWIARIVGQHGAPGEPSFPEYVGRVVSGMNAGTPGAPAVASAAPPGGWPTMPPLVLPGQTAPGAPGAPVDPAHPPLWPGGPAAVGGRPPVMPPPPPPTLKNPLLLPGMPGGPTAGGFPGVAPPVMPVAPAAVPGVVMPPMVAVPPGGKTTQNGWGTITNPGQLTNLPIPGGAQIASGAPAAILGDFAKWFSSNIEGVTASGGYRSGTPFDQQIGSNHMSGTALDLNPNDFPGASGGKQSGAPASTHFSPQQIAAIRAKLATYGGAVNWGEDFGPGQADPMHFEMNSGGPSNPAIAAAYQALGGTPGTYGPAMPSASGYPGTGGAFGAGGQFGSGGGTVPVMVTNWPSMGGAAGGFAGGAGGVPGGAGQAAAQIGLSAASGPIGAAGNIGASVASDAVNAIPGAAQSVFESRAGINAKPVTAVGAADMHDPVQAILAGLGINIPDMSRQGAVNLGNAPFQQGGAGTGGASYDAEGRLLSDTTGLYQRTSTDLDAHLVAMKDQLVGATTDVSSKLAKNALTPIMSAGVSAGMGAIPSAVMAAMGANIGDAAAVPIAAAVSQDGSSSSSASNLGNLPFTAASGIYSGLSTVALAASGGGVSGGTAGQDSVPILGMPGEWMMTTDQVNKMGGFSGMQKFSDALSRSNGVRYMASGGSVLSSGSSAATQDGTNPGTAATGTATLGGDFFGVSQIPIIGPILDILINILLSMMGIQITVRDTMNNLGDTFRQFRGDSFKAFDAQGQLLNDTSGLIDRSQTSTEEATQQRIQILTQVLEGVIQYIIDKVAIPLAEAVGQAAINAASSAGGGALNAIAPGAGSAAGAAGAALGDASVQIAGQVGTDFANAAIPAIGDALATSLIQSPGNSGVLEDLFGGSGSDSLATGFDSSAITGGIAGLLLPLIGLAGLGVVAGPGSGTGALFDDGGLASGVGMLPKATISPERVLSPEMTPAFERLVDAMISGNASAGQSSTTIHAPITVMGNAEAGNNVRNTLLSLM